MKGRKGKLESQTVSVSRRRILLEIHAPSPSPFKYEMNMPNRRIHKKKTIEPQRPRLAARVFLVGVAFGLLCSLAALPNDSCFATAGRFTDGYDSLEKKPTYMLGLARESGPRVPWAIKESVLAPPIGWGVRKIGADSVWAAGVRGAGVVVAILDTGTRYTHVDLADHLWTNIDEIPDNGIDDDSNGYVDDYLGYDFVNGDGDPMDDNGHGTYIAGLVLGDGTAGFSTGVAPEAMLMSLKWIDSLGNGSENDIWEAVWYAVDNGADIICLAVGWADADGWRRDWWRDILTIVADSGRTIVANPGYGTGQIPRRVWMPAAVPPPWLHPDQTLRGEPAGVIAGAAIDSFDSCIGDQIGPTVWPDFPYVPGDPDLIGLLKPDLSAPGVDLISLDYRSDTAYMGPGGGSSGFASPHVAGAVALLRSAYPFSTPAEIDSLLEMTAVDLGEPGKDNFYGAGRVDVWAAYNYSVPGIEEESRRDIRGHLVEAARLECLPNPSFGSVTISYGTPNREPVKIQIYDLGGRIRREILITDRTSVQGSIQWDCTDTAGRNLPSGVYFCRLCAGDFKNTKKMMLMR